MARLYSTIPNDLPKMLTQIGPDAGAFAGEEDDKAKRL